MNEFLTLVGLVCTLFGIMAIYDARIISKDKKFDKIKLEPNTVAKLIKSVGFVLTVIGTVLIYMFY